jgi:DNA-binding CsgD family transcriptional regulator
MRRPARRRPGRGGQGGHEPRVRIRTREVRVLELTMHGWLQDQIAADLGISQGAVSKILTRIDLRVLREVADARGRQMAGQTLRLQHVCAEALRAWEASKTDRTRRRQRKTHGAPGAAGASVAEIVTDNQHGDPRYLDQVRKALADLRKLWALDAPPQGDVRASADPFADMSDEALRAEITRQNQLLGVATPAVVASVSIDAVAPDGADPDAVPPAPATSVDKDPPDGDEH